MVVTSLLINKLIIADPLAIPQNSLEGPYIQSLPNFKNNMSYLFAICHIYEY